MPPILDLVDLVDLEGVWSPFINPTLPLLVSLRLLFIRSLVLRSSKFLARNHKFFFLLLLYSASACNFITITMIPLGPQVVLPLFFGMVERFFNAGAVQTKIRFVPQPPGLWRAQCSRILPLPRCTQPSQPSLHHSLIQRNEFYKACFFQTGHSLFV